MDGKGSVCRFTPPTSLLFDRWVARLPFPRGWVVAAIGMILLIVPALLGYREDVPRLFSDYRAQFIYAFMFVYVLMVVPLVQNTRESVAQSLRPLVQLDDARFQAVVDDACRIRARRELLWLGVGMLIRTDCSGWNMRSPTVSRSP